jgi:hypothetical protein
VGILVVQLSETLKKGSEKMTTADKEIRVVTGS